jgi:hypothetical protein
MQLKALTKSATGMTDEQCEAGKMPGLRGGRELTTTQVAERPSNPGWEPSEIAAPRQVGARNDKSAWCWLKETATKSWRRDLQMAVSSLVLGVASETTISVHEAFSTGRVPVGRGLRTTPQVSLGWSKNKQSNKQYRRIN